MPGPEQTMTAGDATPKEKVQARLALVNQAVANVQTALDQHPIPGAVVVRQLLHACFAMSEGVQIVLTAAPADVRGVVVADLVSEPDGYSFVPTADAVRDILRRKPAP